MLEIDLQDEQITLLPQRALYWAKENTLIVADMHWGKTGHFRKNGIAIPSTTQDADERILSDLIHAYKADRLIVAGDMFHSKPNKETDSFTYWRNQHKALSIELVNGNHDILPRDSYANWNITLHDEVLNIAPFTIAHDEIDTPQGFLLHGHIHPALKIPLKGRTTVRTDCFCINEKSMLLPAFGKFTGRHTINQKDYKQLYIITDDNIIKWK